MHQQNDIPLKSVWTEIVNRTLNTSVSFELRAVIIALQKGVIACLIPK